VTQYSVFIASHFRILAFGFLLAFLSGPGQTHFIGVFGPSIQSEFGLNTATWGQLYMVATLISAAVITWSGSLIDRFKLSSFASIAIICLALACLLMSLIPTNWWWLVLVIFCLRQFGQGLASHSSQTAMVRAFRFQRGKALALTAIGFTLGEAVLPVLALTSIEANGWRETFSITAWLLLASVPIAWWLIRQFDQTANQQNQVDIQQAEQTQESTQYQYQRSEVLQDKRFYLLIPTMMAPSLIITALFFFPGEMANAKGWSVQAVTGHYWLFSLVTVSVSIYSGSLIDRLGAIFVMRLLLIPIALSLIVLSVSNAQWVLLLYMVLLGVGSGINYTVGSALFAELYGTKYFGSIKAVANMIAVFASALGPAFVGGLLNANVSFEIACLYMAVGTAIAYAMMWWAFNMNAKIYK